MSSTQNKSATRPNPLRLVSHMLAALFNSRSAFLQQWRRYEPSIEKPDGIAGRWVGEWVSESNGHHGELKCVLAPVSAGVYRAYFYATFSRFFRVGYATDLKAESTNGRVCLKGEEDLGPLAGGVYRCEGEATANEFNCKYSCKYDHGDFHLRRFTQ
jgi:hypothetical protein